MDRRLQERLVGGLAVAAAAVIFIPELLSGPKPDSAPAVPINPDGATHTYTIDLEHGAKSPAPAETDLTAVPPPEMPNSPQREPTAESAPLQLPSEAHVSLSPSPSPTPTPTPTREAAPVPDEPNHSTAAKPAQIQKRARVTAGWAVQVGSFGTTATAERIAREFQSKGYTSYTQPVQVGGKTWYRVRVGPVTERAEAEALLKKVKMDQSNATLVAEP